jgi:hypothetical protein
MQSRIESMVKAVPLTLTGAQLRAARALVDMSAAELAAETLIEVKTIRRAEAMGNDQVKMTAANVRAVVAVLEKRGVRFIGASKTSGPGVRLRF